MTKMIFIILRFRLLRAHKCFLLTPVIVLLSLLVFGFETSLIVVLVACSYCYGQFWAFKTWFSAAFLRIFILYLGLLVGFLFFFVLRAWDFCSATSFESQKEPRESCVQLSKDTVEHVK